MAIENVTLRGLTCGGSGATGAGEPASTVVTSNKGFEQWGEILHDEVMAAALLDRLLHRCHIVNIRGNSYRMRRHMEFSKAIHPTASRAVSAEHAGNGGAAS